MADKPQTPPPAATAGAASSPLTPAPKRPRMSSPEHTAENTNKDTKMEENTKLDEKAEITEAPASKSTEGDQAQSTEGVTAVAEVATTKATAEENEEDQEEEELEADDGYADSAFGGSINSDTTSVTSSITQGIIENGRRYQATREGEYWGPADEKQFVSMEAAHIVYMLLENNRKNPLFLSPLPASAQHILDVGTGTGTWAKEVADMLPSVVVQGVDLSPPPQDWVPPNCKFEVDDLLKPWDFDHKFDLIHIRDMHGAFTAEQSRLLYKQAYNNLVPGGWIEELEPAIVCTSDDGSLPLDSHLANWDTLFYPICEKMGKPMDTIDQFKSRIEKAGFINVHEKIYKVPMGDWVKNPVLKEAGRFCKTQFLEGMEGYVMFILTHFGTPTPWTPDEVQVYLMKCRQELAAPGLHAYCLKRRVWAQKPFEEEPRAESKTGVVNLT